MRLQSHSGVVLALGLLALSSCQRKEPPKGTPVLLLPGTGAVLVVFPRETGVPTEEWMAQALLEGPSETRSLPRIPLPALRAIMVTHVAPGTYRVVARSWLKHSDGTPTAGGSREGVYVKAGEVAVLQARAVAGDLYPFPKTPLLVMNSAKWTLTSSEELSNFVAGIIQESVKG